MKWIAVCLLLSVCSICSAQTNWYHLPYSPYSLTPGSRFSDMYFVDDTIGWIYGGAEQAVYKTADGGDSWTMQLNSGYTARAIEFINTQVGFAGTISGKVYSTQNGGTTWQLRTDSVFINVRGICGISHFGNLVFMCGSYNGDRNFFRSIDQGNTWSVIKLDSLANRLIDCYFLNDTVGYLSGRGMNGGVILKTVDGGLNWKIVATTGGQGDNYVWKLQFTSATTGYASIENPIDSIHHFFKTTDGGETWVMNSMHGISQFAFQGLWFANDTLGWMGGWTTGMYETRDGGSSWRYLPVGGNFNRFFQTPSGRLFAAGSSIFEYNPNHSTYFDTSHVVDSIPHEIVVHKLYLVYPNPTKGLVTIAYDIGVATSVRIEILESSGKIVAVPKQQAHEPGHYELAIPLDGLANSVYHVIMLTHETHHSQKVILQR